MEGKFVNEDILENGAKVLARSYQGDGYNVVLAKWVKFGRTDYVVWRESARGLESGEYFGDNFSSALKEFNSRLELLGGLS